MALFVGFTLKSLRFNSFQMNAVSSVSLTSAIVSGIAVYQYRWVVSRVLVRNLYRANEFDWDQSHFADKDARLELTEQENTTVAISSLIAIVSTIEVAIAVCAAWSSDSLYQSTQENQVSQVCDIYLMEPREITFISWHKTFSQSEYTKVVVYSMVLHPTFPWRVVHAPHCLCWSISSLSISHSYWTK